MIFPEFWHGARDPYEVASDSQISLTNLGKWTKNGSKTGFFDLKDLVIGFYWICSIMKTISLTIGVCRNGICRVCVCLCSSTCWFLLAARHLWYTWEVQINDLLLWAFSGWFCQVPSSLSLSLSYFTSKDENSSQPLTGEKTIWYNVWNPLKRWYILI